MKAKLKRLLCTVLCIVLCMSLMPVNTQAADYSSEGNCIVLRSDSPFTVKVNRSKGWDGVLDYSYDNSFWHWNWDGGLLTAHEKDGSYVLYFRGERNTKVGGPASNYAWVLDSEGPVECSGNIMTLLDYEHPESATMGDYAFGYLFSYFKNLVSAPSLPATKLAPGCYCAMFDGCANLREAPTLPATTMEKSCYASMFSGCKNLSRAPALPATTMAESCYNCMFYNCTGLTEAPALPAAALAEKCYWGMFQYCSNLREAPALPAATLPAFCYYEMFSDCTSMETPPALLGTPAGSSSCRAMFKNCSSLKSAPVLPGETVDTYCYYEMFSCCTSLKRPPELLPAMTMEEGCYGSMFAYCTSLERATVLPATKMARECYAGMFFGCTNLKLNQQGDGETWSIPKNASVPFAAIDDWNYNMFYGTGGDIDAFPVRGKLYYYAMPASYTVRFEMNGHGSAPDSQTVEEGAAAQQPAEPAEEGWTFTGWFADSALETSFDFSAPITSDTVIYAGWKEVATEVNGGTTHITVTVPECTYTFTIPADTDIPFGTRSLSLGNVTIYSVQGLGSKAIFVGIEHTPMLCGQNAISYDICGKLEAVGPIGAGAGVWNDLGAIDQSTGPICICDNQHLSYTLALTATIAQKAWDSAPAGTYEGHVYYTFTVK